MRNKKTNIADRLRERITSGEYGPGDRLPTRVELENQFGVSSKTLQLAIDTLTGEGYIESCGKRGSFVAEAPPHLTRICLLFVDDFAENCRMNRLFCAIRDSFSEMERAFGVRFELFDRAGELRFAPRIDKLIADIREKRLAGIFFLSTSGPLRGSPVMEEPGISRSMLGWSAPGIPIFSPDYIGFYRLAAQCLAERGVKNPLIIADQQISWEIRDEIFPIFAAAGIPLRPHQLQFGLPVSSRFAPVALLELAFRQSPAPDALLLSDDNTLPEMSAKLRELGFDNLPVIAMANFPYPSESAVPVTRIGFDVSQVLSLAVGLIRDQTAGHAVPPVTRIPAQIQTLSCNQQGGEHEK